MIGVLSLTGCHKQQNNTVSVQSGHMDMPPVDTIARSNALIALSQISSKQDRIYNPASDFTYTTNAGTITITAYVGTNTVVNIPPAISGMPVVSSTMYFELGVSTVEVTRITIPDSVFSINNGFNCVTSLQSVVIGNSLTNITENYFYGCSNLTSVSLGAAVRIIGDLAFEECISLPSITIPASVTNIGMDAFYNCASLSGVYFSGNAPTMDNDFTLTTNLVYYLSGATGFGALFRGQATTLWGPLTAGGIVIGITTNTPNATNGLVKLNIVGSNIVNAAGMVFTNLPTATNNLTTGYLWNSNGFMMIKP